MSNLLWDSSAIVKLLHREEYSSFYIKLFENRNFVHFASEISKVEIHHAIRRKYFDYLGSLNKYERARIEASILKQILPDSIILNSWRSRVSRAFSFIVVDSLVIKEAELLVLGFDIRSLDAIILATLKCHFTQEKDIAFISADKRQLSVAEALRMKILRPERSE